MPFFNNSTTNPLSGYIVISYVIIFTLGIKQKGFSMLV